MKKRLSILYFKFKAFKRRALENIFGNSNYKKFVIISDSRTGSTLLKNSMNFHPQIVAEGEEFKILNSSSTKVWDRIFKRRFKNIRYVGFKLFYHHPLLGDKEVWNYVSNDKKIIILHLKRKNVLRSLVSKKIGLKTKMWTENINSKEVISTSEKKIHLSIAECQNYFNEISEYQHEVDQKFNDHNLIEIFYEDLAENRRLVLENLAKKLDLEPFRKESELKKQNPETLDQLIVNYNELEDYFSKTEWNKYFITNK